MRAAGTFLRVAATVQRELRAGCLLGYGHTRERVWSVQDLDVMVRRVDKLKKSVSAASMHREWVECGPVDVGEGQSPDMASVDTATQ